MSNNAGDSESSVPLQAGVRRRRFITLGTLAAAFTGASSVSSMGTSKVRAAAGDKDPTGEYVFNVKDFGASGDGTGSDTKAIQAAINAAHASGGGRVHLPRGVYNLSINREPESSVDSIIRISKKSTGKIFYETARSCIILRAGVTMSGDGVGVTTLRRLTAGPSMVIELLDFSDGGIHDMSIKGPGAATTVHGVFVSTTKLAGHMNRNVTLRNLEICDMGNYGIGYQYGSPQNLRYQDLWIHDVGDDCIDHKVRHGPIDYLNNGTDGVFLDNILCERWGTRLTDASALDIRGQATVSNITARDFGTTGFRTYGVTLSSGIANGVDKRAATARSTLTNFYIEGKPGFDCVGLALYTGGPTTSTNGHVRWCTTSGVWARPSTGDCPAVPRGLHTQTWVNGPEIVGVTVEGSRAGSAFFLETRASIIGGRVLGDYQYFDSSRGNLAVGQTSLGLWHEPGESFYLVKNGEELAEGQDFTLSGATVKLSVAAVAADSYYWCVSKIVDALSVKLVSWRTLLLLWWFLIPSVLCWRCSRSRRR
ncbi:glycosyl hydrolase family 28-related protein, partial [Pseudarthrobacter sp. H3Y2-7]|uniref:glycosyl hydrolase family 28-related protein n=1 Tax=Pseudarthrobacter naphthalenicus TaxID=3031328 RepID=UPI0023AFCD5E